MKNEIKKIIKERKKLEKVLTKNTKMAAAQFCKRANGSAYLSCYIDGVKRNRYIKKADEKEWKKLTSEWKIFSQIIMKWNNLNNELEKLYREEAKLRLVELPKAKKIGNK